MYEINLILVLQSLFSNSCAPYFSLIEKWIYTANCEDPFGEFLRTNSKISTSDFSIPTDKLLDESLCLPKFLKHLQKEIFRSKSNDFDFKFTFYSCGRTLTLLKLNDCYLDSPMPSLVVFFSFGELTKYPYHLSNSTYCCVRHTRQFLQQAEIFSEKLNENLTSKILEASLSESQKFVPNTREQDSDNVLIVQDLVEHIESEDDEEEELTSNFTKLKEHIKERILTPRKRLSVGQKVFHEKKETATLDKWSEISKNLIFGNLIKEELEAFTNNNGENFTTADQRHSQKDIKRFLFKEVATESTKEHTLAASQSNWSIPLSLAIEQCIATPILTQYVLYFISKF